MFLQKFRKSTGKILRSHTLAHFIYKHKAVVFVVVTVAADFLVQLLRLFHLHKVVTKAADKRQGLEAFLQDFLGNTKNLETNKNEICKHLGAQGIDAGIAGLFQPLINAYKNINDRIAKHNDAVDAKLLEFLLYQTGVLIRMVITTNNGGQA